MSWGEVYLTREGREKLIQELEYLKNTRRKEIAKQLASARAHGDLSENAEYDAAKEAQGFNEKRINDLEQKIAHARIIDEENMPKDEVLIGASVSLLDLDSGEQMQYTLVSEVEADFSRGKISVSSPVGEGLLGHKENETVEIKVPAGVLKYKILKISR